jgi:DNA repair exonuclease SbcCD nuclease subunit
MRLAHTSDLHLLADRSFVDDRAMVDALVAAVTAAGAEVLAVAGDLFDHNRVATDLADALIGQLAGPGLPVVVLPGNHDPLTADSIFRRLAPRAGLFVLGLDGPTYGHADGSFEISGEPHMDYGDFAPLPSRRASVAGDLVVLAHGHFEGVPDLTATHRPGWLITVADLDRVSAAYVGLGHWDRAFTVRESGPPTFYSGSPWFARSFNLVSGSGGGDAAVTRVPIQLDPGAP